MNLVLNQSMKCRCGHWPSRTIFTISSVIVSLLKLNESPILTFDIIQSQYNVVFQLTNFYPNEQVQTNSHTSIGLKPPEKR